jgi:hypothetical protein
MMVGQNSEAQVGVTLEYYDYTSLEDFFKKAKEEVNQFPGIEIISEGEEFINGAPSYGSLTLSRPQWNPLILKSLFGLFLPLLSGEQFFPYNCLTKASQFNDYLDTFQAIARSFTTLTEN